MYFLFFLSLFSECLGYPISNVHWLGVVGKTIQHQGFLVYIIVLIALNVLITFASYNIRKFPCRQFHLYLGFTVVLSEMQSNLISEVSRGQIN